ncbi:transposase, partial [Bacillus thuringiensis]
DETVEIYNQALSFIIKVIDEEFGDLKLFSTKDIVTLVEQLIHATKS